MTPNSDTPYSMLQTGPARRADRHLRAGRAKGTLLRVQFTDMYTFNYGYIGSRATGNDAGCYMVAGPGLEGRNARGNQGGLPQPNAVRTDRLPDPTLQSRRHRQRGEDPGRLQRPASLRLRPYAGSPRRRRPSTGPSSTESKFKTRVLPLLELHHAVRAASARRDAAAGAASPRSASSRASRSTSTSSRRPESRRACRA